MRSPGRSPSPPPERMPLTHIEFPVLNAIPSIGTKDVVLPPELLSEPYSASEPVTDDQIELRVVRPKFLFKVDEFSTAVVVGHKVISDAEDYLGDDELPLVKNSTSCSVLNIYDSYGLDITYTFLKYIYENKFIYNHEMWLVVYLQGSYFHITGHTLDMAVEMNSLEAAPVLITYILLELLARERAEFKLGYELTSVPSSYLPPELVSRMVGSSRVSKEVTKGVRAIRCNTIPTLEEVAELSGSSSTYLLADGSFYSISTGSYGGDETATAVLLSRTVTRTSDIFNLQVEVAERSGRLLAYMEGGEPIVCEPLQSYANFFKSKGCNIKASMLLLFSNLRARLLPITNKNATEACAWIVQLIMDLGVDREESTKFTMKELSDELEHLISNHEGRYR